MRIGGLRVILRRARRRTVRQMRNGLAEQLRAQLRQTLKQLLRVLVRSNRRLADADDITGVQFFCHMHDGNAGFFLALQNRAVDGRRAAVLRQHGGMHVDAAQRGHVQNGLRQELPVGRHHRQLGPERAQQGQRFVTAQALRLVDRQAAGQRVLLHRRHGQLFAVAGPVRLGEYAHNLMTVLYQPAKGRDGKGRCTHKNNSHSSSSNSSG